MRALHDALGFGEVSLRGDEFEDRLELVE